MRDDLPILLTVAEVAALCKTGTAAIRVRVSRGQLRPAAQTSSGHLLFAATDIGGAPMNRRLRDSDSHAV